MARYKAVILAYLPNKKILLLIVFILLIFAGWFYFSSYKNKQTQYIADKEKSPLAVALDTTSQLDADSDGDGLKDWEELLWKTDSSKADTDGDGTNDNEEITLNRNPLKAGPDDKISDKEDLVAQEKAVSESKQNTLTAAYARKFLTDYMMLKQQKGELSDLDKNNLVKKFMSNIEPLVVVDKYKLSDLKINNDASKEAMKNYANQVKKILFGQEHLFVDNDTVFENLLKKIKDKDKDLEKEKFALGYSASMYVWLAEQLLKISPVPNIIASSHLAAVNNFYNTSIALETMIDVDADPIKGMMAKSLYQEQLKKSFDYISGIKKLLNDYEVNEF